MKRFYTLAALLVLWIGVGAVASIPQEGRVWRNLSPYVWLFQGMPVEATYTPSAVQSIQHATCTISGTTGTASFTAVDLNYAVISAGGSGVQNGGSTSSAHATKAIFSSTSSATCASTATGTVFNFDVIYFVPSLLKHAVVRDLAVTVPIGVNSNGTSSTGYTVNLAKTTTFFQGCRSNNTQSVSEVSFSVLLPNTTQVTVYKNLGDYGFDCNVSVVEFK